MRLISDLITHHFDVFTAAHGTRRIPPHMHHFHQLDIYLDGTSAVQIAGLDPFRAGRAEGVLIPPLVSHGYDVLPGLVQATFKINLAPQYWRLFGTQARRFTVPEYLLTLVAATDRKCREDTALQHSLLMAVAEVALCELRSRNGTAEPGETLVSPGGRRADLWPVLEQLHGSPGESRSVAGMARQLGLSSDHFAKLFTAVTGESPRRYILALRMRAAAEELLRHDAPAVKTVADRFGYSTVHAFTRAFKRVFGAGPATYRRVQARF